jgi:hypothetical protein
MRRQNLSLATALSATLRLPVRDVMVSHDRCRRYMTLHVYSTPLIMLFRYTIYRATELSDVGIDGSSYRTGRENIHLDLNPWWYAEASHQVIKGLNTLMYKDCQV